MGLGLGGAIALLVADLALAVATGFAFRRRTGRLLPFVLAVAAGVVFVLLVTAVVGLIVLS